MKGKCSFFHFSQLWSWASLAMFKPRLEHGFRKLKDLNLWFWANVIHIYCYFWWCVWVGTYGNLKYLLKLSSIKWVCYVKKKLSFSADKEIRVRLIPFRPAHLSKFCWWHQKADAFIGCNGDLNGFPRAHLLNFKWI